MVKQLIRVPHEFTLPDPGHELRLVFSGREEGQSEDGKTYSGLVVGACRTCDGDDFRPLQLNMTHNRPDCAAEFDNFFRSSITYPAAENSISWRRHDLGKGLPTANADLATANGLTVVDHLACLNKTNVTAQVV